MKRITQVFFVLFMCLAGTLQAQKTTSFMDTDFSTLTRSTQSTTTINQLSEVVAVQTRAVTSSFTDRAAFQASCASLPFEDFAGGPAPGGIIGCNDISSAGSACYPANEIITGFIVTANTGAVVALGTGFTGNTSDAVGADLFSSFTIITFTDPTITSAGMDILSFAGTTQFRVFDAVGSLTDTFVLTNPTNSENFFGIVTDSPIGRIEIQADGNQGELIENFEFGVCAVNSPPTAVCQDITVQLDATGNATIVGTDVDGGSTDPDGDTLTFSVTPDTFDCSDVGTPQTVTLTVDDGNGTTDTCTATVTIEDTIDPVITCPADITVSNDVGNCSAVITYADPVGSDNCDVMSTQTYAFTGVIENFIVPAGVTSLSIETRGAQGGRGGGFGAMMSGDFTVTPGEVLKILVGGEGVGGPNDTGSGGGGGSFVTTSTNTPLIIAGGGGGTGHSASNGSYVNIQGDIGLDGQMGQGTTAGAGGIAGNGGQMGTTIFAIANNSAGGGGLNTDGGGSGPVDGGDAFINGGSGGMNSGGFGGGGGGTGNIFSCGQGNLGGSGGGGYSGGGGGGLNCNGAGGGGGSFNNGFNQVNSSGVQAGNGEIIISYGQSVMVVQTDGLPSGSAFPVGTTTNTFVVTDTSGNTATCSFDVTVNDTEDPTITCPGDITVSNDPGVCGAVVTYIDPTVTDNCGGVMGTETFDFTGASQTFTVPPGVTSITIDAFGAAGQASTLEDYAPSTGGLGGMASGTLAVTPGDVLNVYVGGTGTDGAGGFNGGADGGFGTPTDGSAGFAGSGGGASDIRIGGAMLANRVLVAGGGGGGGRDYVNGTCQPCGEGGNGGAGGALVGENGMDAGPGTSPTGPFPNVGSGGFGGDQAMGGAGGAGNGPTGNPGILGVGGMGLNGQFSTASGGAGGGYYGGGSGGGTNPGGGHAGGGAAGGSSYIDGVTGGSTTAGVRSGNGQIIISYGGSLMVAQTAGLPSGSTFPVGTTTNTFVVTDASGNTATCSFDVTVTDDENPVVTCPADITVNNEPGLCSAVVTFTPTVTDNCTGATVSSVPASGSIFPVGTTTVIVTGTDAAGNTSTCSFDVTVIDNEPPVAVCMDITVQLDASGNANIVAADVDGGSTDNCGIASLAIDIDTFDCSNVGPNTVTLTITDNSGNIDTCTAIVTVEDTFVPLMNCPADFTVGTDTGLCAGTASFADPIPVDNCGIASLVQTAGLPSGSVFPIGPNLVEYTATDVNGNTTTCSFTITVVDDDAPIAVCMDITVLLDATGTVTIVPADVDGGSTDNCAIDMLSIDMDTFTCADLGPNTVTLTVTDTAGFSSTCTAIVTVQNGIDPVAVCQDATVQLDALGMVTIVDASIFDGGSTDGCGSTNVTFSVSPDSFTCAELGDNTVTITVTDDAGNTSTCTAVVTVEDVTNPTVVCVDATIELDANGMATIDPAILVGSSEDACGITAISADIVEFSCDDIGSPVLVTVMVEDASGNSATCAAMVTVVDLLAPTLTCPADQIVNADTGDQFTLPDYFATGDATAVDNCTDPVTITSQSPTAGTLLDQGVYTIAFTAEDAYGNISTCEFELTVDGPLGIDDNNINLSTLTMYPNPANDYVLLSNPQSIPLKDVSIYDVTGRLIKKLDASQVTSEMRIDISELASATYMVLINTETGQVTKQLVKN